MRPKCQWWLAILCNFCKAEISRNPYIIHNLFLSFFLKAPKRYLFKDLSLFHQFRASCRRGVFKILDPKQPALFQRFWAACLQRYVSPSSAFIQKQALIKDEQTDLRLCISLRPSVFFFLVTNDWGLYILVQQNDFDKMHT